jgi:hypothetical protein
VSAGDVYPQFCLARNTRCNCSAGAPCPYLRVGDPAWPAHVPWFTLTDLTALAEARVREIVREELIRSGVMVDKGGER